MTRSRTLFCGFTVTELLVSLSVISILSGLLFPGLCRAKAQSRSVSCKNNLRQIGLALTMYVGDFGHYLTEGEWMKTAGQWYADRKFTPYTANNRAVFLCPTHKPTGGKKADPNRFDPLSYGYNSFGSESWRRQNLGLGGSKSHPVSVSQVTAPTEMIAFGDSGTDTAFDLLLNPNQKLLDIGADNLSTLNSWLPSKRHRGGANILLCDGHVEYAAQERWIERSIEGRRRWNNDNEPHPETWW